MTLRSPREIADEVVERIEYRIQAHHPTQRRQIRDLIEGTIEDDRAARDGETVDAAKEG